MSVLEERPNFELQLTKTRCRRSAMSAYAGVDRPPEPSCLTRGPSTSEVKQDGDRLNRRPVIRTTGDPNEHVRCAETI